MELSEFIAEIKTDLRSYDSANLIDDISIQNWVIDELKRFGSNIMDLQEKFIPIKNGQGRLPNNYWHLKLALKVTPEKFENIDGDNEDVRYSLQLAERLERNAVWKADGESVEVTETALSERIYVNNNRVDVYYSSPILLNIKRGVLRKTGEFECLNLTNKFSKQSPFDIVINNRTIQTSFPEGNVYIRYYGFLADEQGNIIIPETQHNRLKTYLEYHVKSKIFENLAANGDDANVGNMLGYYKQEARNQFTLAMTETKMEALNWKSTRKKMREQNQRKMRIFENMFPNK